MERVAWMVPFARRVRMIRMCFLNARGLGPIQATLLKASNKLLRPCLGQGASQGEEAVLADSGREGEVVAGVGRVRSMAFLSILRAALAPLLFPKKK
jgi:hypothetical protein